MAKFREKPFYWYPFSGNRRIKYRRPKFKDLIDSKNNKIIELIEMLHETLIKKESSFIDTGHLYIYNHDYKSLLIDYPDCGPLIEFYFHRFAPLLHVCITNLEADSKIDFIKQRKHYLLTITDDLLSYYEYYENDSPHINWLEGIYSDGRRVYQLRINNVSLICLRSGNKFLSMNAFLNDIDKCFNIDKLQYIIEKILFNDI